jgi:hypothetical protein
MSSSYFDMVRPTYIENWPDALVRLSIAQAGIRLDREMAEVLGGNILEFHEAFPEPWFRPLTALEAQLDQAMAQFPAGVFVRLGSRSPKDSFLGCRRGFRCESGAQALALLCDASERVYEDLSLALAQGYDPWVWVRQWLTIEPWQEFRCFMRGRELVGISQYNYHEHFPQVVEYHDSITWAIRSFFDLHFRAACHLSDVVFDVLVQRREYRHADGLKETAWEVKLLEINPYCAMTDPCLFNWNKPEELDGSLRFRQEPRRRDPDPSEAFLTEAVP